MRAQKIFCIVNIIFYSANSFREIRNNKDAFCIASKCSEILQPFLRSIFVNVKRCRVERKFLFFIDKNMLDQCAELIGMCLASLCVDIEIVGDEWLRASFFETDDRHSCTN